MTDTSETLRLLGLLLRARRFDEKLLEVADEITGHWHVSIGFEATAAGVALARREDDVVMTNYRNHAHLACLGADLAVMFAEILGRDLGPQRGRAGSFHLGAPEIGVPYTSAMVSGAVPLTLGLAFARLRSGSDGIAMCFFGDGAFNEGGLHECFNLASLWKLPVLFVCENNSSPRSDGQANDMQSAPSLRAIAEVHRVPGTAVDARQPREVADAVADLVAEVRAHDGPRFIEALGPSWPGNASFFPRDATGPLNLDDATRTTGDEWRDVHDPALHECRRLLASGVPLEKVQAIDAEVRAEINAAMTSARAAPLAPPSAALEGVFASR